MGESNENWELRKPAPLDMFVQIPHTFNVHGSVHRNNILVYKSQQDAHVTGFSFVRELLCMFRVSLSPIFRSIKQL